MSHAPKSKRFDMYDKLSELLDDKKILEEAIKLNLVKIQRERARLERYIETIEDAEMRLIFRLRHINGMTFRDIATEIGYKGHYRESTVRKKYAKYLEVSEISD